MYSNRKREEQDSDGRSYVIIIKRKLNIRKEFSVE